MSDSTRRSIRTAYQVVVAIITYVPIILPLLPADVSASEAVVAFGAWVAVVTRIVNALEDRGVIPAWLK